VGKVVGDFRRQAVQTFENLKTALAAVGAQFRNVVKFNNYLVDRAPADPMFARSPRHWGWSLRAVVPSASMP